VSHWAERAIWPFPVWSIQEWSRIQELHSSRLWALSQY